MTDIVHEEEHSGGSATIDGTGIRVANVAGAYVYNGYSPDEIADFYPDLTLEDIHTAIAYFYGHPEEFEGLRGIEDDTRGGEQAAF